MESDSEKRLSDAIRKNVKSSSNQELKNVGTEAGIGCLMTLIMAIFGHIANKK